MSATPHRVHGRTSSTPGRRGRPPVAGSSPMRQTTPRRSSMDDAEGIQVAIRMRPLNANEGEFRRVWKVLPKWSSVTQTTPEGKPLAEKVTGRTFFTYDQTFGEETTNEQVYGGVVKGIVESSLTGLNGTVFAYGQTSSGKTYTMQGSGTIQEGAARVGGGIVHMAAADIFAHIRSTQDRIFLVRASFLEIYNEEVRDLLTPNNKVLQIREDPRRGVFVQSEEALCKDFDSLLGVLVEGEKSRAFASTAMNERSSRSHTIFRITIESREKGANLTKQGTSDSDNDDDDEEGAVLISTLNLVDLAGSESVRHTGATGERQKEGGNINKSLLTLSRVIVALGTPNQQHVNFRDSKLTRILQPSLSGNARMAVICCATPSELYLEETRSTLQFASRAKLVKTRAQVNEVLDDRSLIRRLQKELAEARRNGGGAADTEEVRALEERAAQAGSAARVAQEKLRRLQDSILNNGVIFAGDTVTETTAPATRKRRLSDGGLRLGNATPAKPQTLEIDSPKTLPRPTKKGKHVLQSALLSPSSELALLRQALMAKSDSLSAVKGKVDELLRLVETKESEIVDARSSHELVLSERDGARQESEQLSASISTLKAELEAATREYEESVEEKEAAIQDALTKLEEQVADRRVLEQTVDSLQDDKLTLEQQLVAAKETADHQLTELTAEFDELALQVKTLSSDKTELCGSLENVQSQLQTMASEHESVKEQLQAVQQEKEQLASELSQSISAREELEAIVAKQTSEAVEQGKVIAELSRDLQRTVNQNSDLATKVSTLESNLETFTTDFALLQSNLSQSERTRASSEGALSKERGRASLLVIALESCTEMLRQSQLESAAKSSTIDCAQSQLSASVLKEEALTRDLAKLEGELSEAQHKIESLEGNLGETEEELNKTVMCWESSKSHLEEAQQNINRLESALENAKGDHDRLHADVVRLTLANAESAERIASLERDVSDTQEELATSRQALADSQETSRALSDQLASVHGELESTKSQLTSCEQKVASLTESLNVVSTEKGEVFDQWQAVQDELSSVKCTLGVAWKDVEEARAEMGQRTEKLADAEARVLELESMSDVLEASKRDLETKLSQSEAQVATLQRLLDVSDEEVQVARGNVDQRERAILSAEERAQELTCAMQALKSTNIALQKELCCVEQSKAKLESVLANMESELAESKSDLERTSLDLSRACTERDRAVAEVDSIQKSLETSEKEIALLNESLQNAGSDKDSSSQELQAANAERDAMVSRLAELENVLQAKQDEFNQLANTNATLQFEHNGLQAKYESLTTVADGLRAQQDGWATALKAVEEEAAVLKEKNAALERELRGRGDELLSVHDMLESSNSKMAEARQRVCDLEDEVESKLKMLSQAEKTFEDEKEGLASQVASLTTAVEELTVEKQALEKELEAASLTSIGAAVDDLEKENLDLKQLLASSNETIDNARKVECVLRQELESTEKKLCESVNRLAQLEQELQSLKLPPETADHQATQALKDDCRALELALNRERDERVKSEAILRLRMGEEQRALIQEADKNMTLLQREVQGLKEARDLAESEAYTAREASEELRDQVKRYLKKNTQLETQITQLEKEATRLQQISRAAERHVDESRTAQKAIVDLRTSLRKTMDEKERLQVEMQQMQDRTTRLQSQLQASSVQNKENADMATVSLQQELKELTKAVQMKDERIRKLEKAKMTKAMLEKNRRIEAERKSYLEQLQAAEKRIASLEQNISSVSPEDSELSALRFDKQALESKLRKHAAHCQTLEDEKARALQVMQNSRYGHLVDDGDFGKAFVSLGDRLASLEQGFDRSGGESASLRATVKSLQERNEVMRRSNAELQQKMNELGAQNETIRKQLKEDRQEFAKYVSETRAKVGMLESENLRLTQELQSRKKQVANLKAENNLLRVNGCSTDDDMTFELEKVRKRVHQQDPSPHVSSHAKMQGNVTSTPIDKENSSNARGIPRASTTKSARKPTGSSMSISTAPGLGEPHPSDDINTGECQQS